MRRTLFFRAAAAVPLILAAATVTTGPADASAAYPGRAAAAGPSVLAWGDNSAGELGNGTLAGTAAPVAVSGLAGVRAISAAGRHELALRANGTAMGSDEGRVGKEGRRGGRSRWAREH